MTLFNSSISKISLVRLAANLDLIKAQTQKTEAEAQNIAGVEKDLKTSQWELTKQQVKTEKGKTQNEIDLYNFM